MGAHSFTETSTVQDVAAAYEQLVASALHINGHDSYNGSISTTNGYRVVTRRPVTSHEAERLVERRIEDLQKWGPCEAVPVGAPSKTRQKTVRFTVPCPATKPGESVAVTAETVAAALGVPVSRLASFEVLESAATFTTRRRPAGPSTKYWTTSIGGKFDSKAEAFAYAAQRMEREVLPVSAQSVATRIMPIREVTVFQESVRSPEAAVVRTLKAWKVKVRAHVTDSDDLVFHHWLFYGWAAS